MTRERFVLKAMGASMLVVMLGTTALTAAQRPGGTGRPDGLTQGQGRLGDGADGRRTGGRDGAGPPATGRRPDGARPPSGGRTGEGRPPGGRAGKRPGGGR